MKWVKQFWHTNYSTCQPITSLDDPNVRRQLEPLSRNRVVISLKW